MKKLVLNVFTMFIWNSHTIVPLITDKQKFIRLLLTKRTKPVVSYQLFQQADVKY